MNVLLDATALMHGGGVQVGLALLSNAATHGTQWHAVLSANLARECPAEVLEAMASVRVVPTAGRGRLWHAQRLLRDAYRQCRPDAVFTVFGPRAGSTPSPHIGFARPHRSTRNAQQVPARTACTDVGNTGTPQPGTATR